MWVTVKVGIWKVDQGGCSEVPCGESSLGPGPGGKGPCEMP